MEWISVKDRLPNDEEDYLIIYLGWDDLIFHKVLYYCKTEKVWYDNNMDEYIVTHWQPLPEPPSIN